MRLPQRNIYSAVSNLFAFRKDPYGFFENIKPKQASNLVQLRLGYRQFYFCYHPDQVKHILQDHRQNYPKSSLVLKKIQDLSGDEGLIQLSDDEAKAVRQSAAQLMHPEKGVRLSDYVGKFVSEEFERFDEAAVKGATIDLKPFLTQLVLRTAGIFILNEDVKGRAGDLNEAFVELNRMAGRSLGSLFPTPFSIKRKRYLQTIHREVDKIIDEKLRTREISLLHALAEKNVSRSFLRDQVKAFMFAGYDTTASSLIFAVDSVARRSDVQEKIYAERNCDYRSAFYTQATYRESLRLYPSAYFLPRQVKEDDQIMGQSVTAGSQIFISVRHIQRNPEIYSKPDDFVPERFLNSVPHKHAFLPFGGGARACIGAVLAVLEATTTLKKLCERYRMTPVDRHPPAIEGLITAHTKSPLRVRLERRQVC